MKVRSIILFSWCGADKNKAAREAHVLEWKKALYCNRLEVTEESTAFAGIVRPIMLMFKCLSPFTASESLTIPKKSMLSNFKLLWGTVGYNIWTRKPIKRIILPHVHETLYKSMMWLSTLWCWVCASSLTLDCPSLSLRLSLAFSFFSLWLFCLFLWLSTISSSSYSWGWFGIRGFLTAVASQTIFKFVRQISKGLVTALAMYPGRIWSVERKLSFPNIIDSLVQTLQWAGHFKSLRGTTLFFSPLHTLTSNSILQTWANIE